MRNLFVQDIGLRGNTYFFFKKVAEIVIAVTRHFTEQREADVLGEIFIDEINDILDGIDRFVSGTVGTLMGDQNLIQERFCRKVIKRLFFTLGNLHKRFLFTK